MGVLDYVNVEMPCPYCGEHLEEFQSKDGPCSMDVVDAAVVQRFYTICGNCRKWVEFYIPQEDIQEEEIGPPMGLDYVQSLGFKLVGKEEE